MDNKRCYVFYSPNGGAWEDGSTDPRPSPTEDGMLGERDRFVWPEGAEKIKREGYRLHTSQNFLNVLRFYTADGKGGGFDPEKICNGYGYDCWPYNAMELTRGGHDENWFSPMGMGLEDGDSVTLYIFWDPVITYDMGDITVRDFVYKTDGDEYTILGTGGRTNYSLNRMDYNVEGYRGPVEIPDMGKKLLHWVDDDGNLYIPGKEYTIKEPLALKAVFETPSN